MGTADPGLRRLVLGTLLAAFDGHQAPDWALQLVVDGLAGYVLFGRNVADLDQVSSLTYTLRSARADVLVGIDEEGGDVTRLGHQEGSRYPGNGALGAIGDPALTTTIYRAIGADLATIGINVNLAPTIDVNTASDNPIIGTRSFGADPHQVARHAAAAVTGLQDAGVAACAKHFPGHGATIADSHLELPTIDVSLDALRARDLPPFAAAIAAGTQAIMTAHIRVPELTGDGPATFSRRVLVDLLRDELGFTGAIITDALEMQGAARIAGGTARAAVPALVAGADLLCIGTQVTAELVEQIVANVLAAVSDGRLSLARLEDAAVRAGVLAAWIRSAASPQLTSSRDDLRLGDAQLCDGWLGDGRLGDGWLGDSRLGVVAARRAVTIEGTPPSLVDALVVQLESASTIAEGRVPWGLYPHLVTRTGGTTPIRVSAATTSAAELHDAAAGRPIVIVGRNLHRSATAAALIAELATTDAVVAVEMGWPSTWRPAGVRAFVTTYGASQANSRATVEALGMAA